MNLRFLKTLIAIKDHGTFSAAGATMGLSHSAVSLHIKALEEELQIELFDRSKRPPVLTQRGQALIEHAAKLYDIIDDIQALKSNRALSGTLSIGVVPSAMTHFFPAALAKLKTIHPQLHTRIKTGLSGDIVQQVKNRDLDVAIATEPQMKADGLQTRMICNEPLYVLAPKSAEEVTDKDLLTSYPFIWFSRKTFAGQNIERILYARKIRVQEVMEVESLEAIQSLVCHGLGVAVAPKRVYTPDFSADLKTAPFTENGKKQSFRVLAQCERTNHPRKHLTDALFEELVSLAV